MPFVKVSGDDMEVASHWLDKAVGPGICPYRNWGAAAAGKELSLQRGFISEDFFKFFRSNPLERLHCSCTWIIR
jgi:hypothetical protein